MTREPLRPSVVLIAALLAGVVLLGIGVAALMLSNAAIWLKLVGAVVMGMAAFGYFYRVLKVAYPGMF